jgi:hypothetical protein
VAEYDALAQCFDALKGALETNNNSFLLPFSDCDTKYCVAEIRVYTRAGGNRSRSPRLWSSTMAVGTLSPFAFSSSVCDLFAGMHGGPFACIYISVSGDAPRK